ncbi:uncharacterized protein LOC114939502 isoform X2 [Nylanderia fulva]|uniref:uncharacterized protein LOC114938567 isoform X2 n=1 Tax=Nylanderia fulva TaxID=613905 RepID=UPI0010FB22EB|nr:uncharacterized protein LOC114938567 isoform X2 [Nylanderia fulva]XP_029169635.1 uncharacterized protein LOC114939502 isoform X2 [Nylanderia fulva]
MSTDTSMELVKAKLSDLSLLLLRAEGRKYGIILPSQDKDRWIDEILDHIIRQEKLQLEKNSEQTETTMKEQNPSHSDVSGNLKENHPSSNLSFKIDSQDQASTNTQPQSYSSLKEQIELQKEQMDQQKDMLQQLQLHITTQPQRSTTMQHLVPTHIQHQCSTSYPNQGSSPETPLLNYYKAQESYSETPQVTDYADSQIPVFSPQGMVRHKFQDTNNNLVPEMSFAATAQSIKFLTNSISSFGGTEDEDISLWLEKIETIADNYGLSPIVRLSAATSKLNKVARRWMDLSPGNINKSWDTFKDAIIRRFKRRILFNVLPIYVQRQ